MEFILFGCGVCMFLFASGQLLTKEKKPVHYCMAAVCSLFSYVLFYFWTGDRGLVSRLPAAFASSDISAVFLTAPAFYLASLGIIHGGTPPVRHYAGYFIPSMIFAIGFSLYNGFAAPASVRIFATMPGRFHSIPLTILTMLSYLSFSMAIVLDLLAARRVGKTGTMPQGSTFRTQVVFLFVYLAVSLLLPLGCLFRNERLIVTAGALLGLVAVGFTLTCTTISYFGHGAIEGPPRPSVARPEWDASAADLTARLDRLMQKAAPYRDATLTMPRLARALGVETRRLSYYFKTNLGSNFRGYIGDLRLRAVCRDLVEKPEASILDIALENGFNSKSSFNTLFFKAYGRTPREFRSRLKSPANGNGERIRPRKDRGG